MKVRRMNPSRHETMAWIAAAVGLLVFALAAWIAPVASLQVWLAVWLLATLVSVGCLVPPLVHDLTGGAWALPIRARAVATARTVPLLALAFVPIGAGLRLVFPWAHVGVRAEPTWYLNAGFFYLRAAVYFAVWWWLGRRLTQRRRPGHAAASALGLIACVSTVSLASVDWVVSLVPGWYSSISGLMATTTAVLAASAWLLLCSGFERANEAALPQARLDLGTLLLALVLLWGYLAFMEFLTVWTGNLPREIAWYLPRLRTDWRCLSLAVALGNLVLPFLALLPRAVRGHRARLGIVAGGLLLAQALYVYWLVMPSLHPATPTLHWSLAAALFAIGPAWLATIWWQARRLHAEHET